MTDLIAALTTEEKRTLLILLMEDIRGAFDLEAGPRTQAVIDLASALDYDQTVERAIEYVDQVGYRDGRHFRTAFKYGGYESPPFEVHRRRATASPALIAAVDGLCEYPESRLVEDGYL